MMAPMGTKTMPKVEKSRITSRGVRIGRHAFSVCCFRAEPSGGGMRGAAEAKELPSPPVTKHLASGRTRQAHGKLTHRRGRQTPLFCSPLRIVHSHTRPHTYGYSGPHKQETRRRRIIHGSRRTRGTVRAFSEDSAHHRSSVNRHSSSPVRFSFPRRPTNLERARTRGRTLTSQHGPASHSSSSLTSRAA